MDSSHRFGEKNPRFPKNKQNHARIQIYNTLHKLACTHKKWEPAEASRWCTRNSSSMVSFKCLLDFLKEINRHAHSHCIIINVALKTTREEKEMRAPSSHCLCCCPEEYNTLMFWCTDERKKQHIFLFSTGTKILFLENVFEFETIIIRIGFLNCVVIWSYVWVCWNVKATKLTNEFELKQLLCCIVCMFSLFTLWYICVATVPFRFGFSWSRSQSLKHSCSSSLFTPIHTSTLRS